jgi:hypothetical protein
MSNTQESMSLLADLLGVSKTKEQAVSLETRRVSRQRRTPTQPAVEATGVPITTADWNYREDSEDTSVPSKRQNRNRSGRAGRRMYNGLQTVQSVGGYASPLNAIYAPSDKELCVVVDPRTGYKPDGTPNRDPAPAYTVVHRGL